MLLARHCFSCIYHPKLIYQDGFSYFYSFSLIFSDYFKEQFVHRVSIHHSYTSISPSSNQHWVSIDFSSVILMVELTIRKKFTLFIFFFFLLVLFIFWELNFLFNFPCVFIFFLFSWFLHVTHVISCWGKMERFLF